MNAIENTKTLKEVATENIPLPKGAILFGMAEDGFPVLFNTYLGKNSNTVFWETSPGEGRVVFRSIVKFIDLYESEPKTNYVVFSNDGGVSRNTFQFHGPESEKAVSSLWEWYRVGDGNPIIIFIDEINNINTMSEQSKRILRKFMRVGFSKKIHFIGSSKDDAGWMKEWGGYFPINIYGTAYPRWWQLDLEEDKSKFFIPE